MLTQDFHIAMILSNKGVHSYHQQVFLLWDKTTSTKLLVNTLPNSQYKWTLTLRTSQVADTDVQPTNRRTGTPSPDATHLATYTVESSW